MSIPFLGIISRLLKHELIFLQDHWQILSELPILYETIPNVCNVNRCSRDVYRGLNWVCSLPFRFQLAHSTWTFRLGTHKRPRCSDRHTVASFFWYGLILELKKCDNGDQLAPFYLRPHLVRVTDMMCIGLRYSNYFFVQRIGLDPQAHIISMLTGRYGQEIPLNRGGQKGRDVFA